MNNFRTVKTRHGYYEIDPVPSASDLREFYADKYYQEASGSYQVEYSKKEKYWMLQKSKLRRKFVEDFVVREDTGELSLLDVGAGEGFTMREFYEAGWSVKGVDFSTHGIKKQNPSMLPFFKQGDIYELIQQEWEVGNSYSCILLQNVLEHVTNPGALLEGVAGILQPAKAFTKSELRKASGVLIVVVPNDFSQLQNHLLSLGMLHSNYWVSPPEHLSYFTRESLISLATDSGLKEITSIGDFAIDMFLFNRLSDYVTNPRFGKEAHEARIEIESFVLSQDWRKVFEYFRSALDVGLARNVVSFFSLVS